MKTPTILILGSLLLTACQPTQTPTAVDSGQAEKEVTQLLDRYHQASKSMDVPALKSLLTENGLFCGTDPGEMWSREGLIGEYERMAATEGLEMDYTVDTRKIRLAEDGGDAVVVEQMVVGLASLHIPLRMVYYLVRSDNGWLIDFSSSALIAPNEDLAKINAVYQN